MTDDWATALTTKLLDNTPELKHVTLREIMASALRAERERCIDIAQAHRDRPRYSDWAYATACADIVEALKE